MNVRTSGPFVEVQLSERNLLALLAEFDKPAAQRAPLIRRTEDGSFLTVSVQDDVEHYGDRQPGPAGDAFARERVND